MNDALETVRRRKQDEIEQAQRRMADEQKAREDYERRQQDLADREWRQFLVDMQRELAEGLKRKEAQGWLYGDVVKVARSHNWRGKPRAIEEVAAWPLRVRTWAIVFTDNGEIWHSRISYKGSEVYTLCDMPRVSPEVRKNILDRLRAMAR